MTQLIQSRSALSAIIQVVIRHALAPIMPAAAAALHLPRTLGETPAPPAVAITFDDGPHPQGTPTMLNILADHGARATFFLIGEQVERRPLLAEQILAEGHQIALHGYRHRLQLRLTPAELEDDLRRGLNAITEATGVTPTLHRPPYGIYSAAGLRLVRESQLQPLLWTTWGKDWRKFTTSARIAYRATAGLSSGDVILLHDADFYSAKESHERTAGALSLILSELKTRGFGTVLTV